MRQLRTLGWLANHDVDLFANVLQLYFVWYSQPFKDMHCLIGAWWNGCSRSNEVDMRKAACESGYL